MDLCTTVLSALQGPAAAWAYDLAASEKFSWSRLRPQLIARFAPIVDRTQFGISLLSRAQAPSETVLLYATALEAIARRFDRSASSPNTESLLIGALLHGLRPRTVAYLKGLPDLPNRWPEFVHLAVRVADAQGETLPLDSSAAPINRIDSSPPDPAAAPRYHARHDSRPADPRVWRLVDGTPVCRNCRRVGHISTFCRDRRSFAPRSSDDDRRRDHRSRDFDARRHSDSHRVDYRGPDRRYGRYDHRAADRYNDRPFRPGYRDDHVDDRRPTRSPSAPTSQPYHAARTVAAPPVPAPATPAPDFQ